MTIEEHITEGERMLALAHEAPSGQSEGKIRLAMAHFRAAEILHLRELREDNRQVSRDLKANSAFMTDLVSKVLPQGETS